MKLRNKTNMVQPLINRKTNWRALVSPGEIIEMEEPLLDNRTKKNFTIIESKKEVNLL